MTTEVRSGPEAPTGAAGSPAAGPPASAAPHGPGVLDRAPWSSWQRPYALALVTFDAAAVVIAGVVSDLINLDADQQLGVHHSHRSYSLVALVLVPAWLAVIAVSGGYASRRLGNGSEEYRSVVVAGVRMLAALSVFVVLNEMVVSRRFLVGFIALGTVLLVVDRYLARRWLHAQRNRGHALEPAVVVGTRHSATGLIGHLRRTSYAGIAVVGACVPGDEPLVVDGSEVPVVGRPDEGAAALERAHATALVVTGAADLGDGGLRRLAWSLEGSGAALIVAPELTDIAGPRIAVRPLSGLPLLSIEEPGLSGPARLFKAALDKVLGIALLVVLSPLLLVVAMLVKVTSSGPVFFRQERAGKDGKPFQMIKFRTMVDSAETDLAGLLESNEQEGPLFKMRNDPRITPLGRKLRRLSIDELPQLVHVVSGKMSLVGPRPPLPSEVEQYGDDVKRRLLVKPGMTGLWQVSGRADLAWDESVRLDLYYVDSWSPALDLVILWKTVNAVVRGKGAY